MTSDTRFKLALFLLLTALGVILVSNLRGMDSLPSSDTLAIRPSPITLDVIPKITVRNEHRKTAFRVYFRIESNEDNREYAYSATCGSELKSSIRQVQAVSYTIFEELTVLENCWFQVCLSRIGEKTPFCVKQEVKVEGG